MKRVTEDVAELKLIIKTTDKLVDAVKDQGNWKSTNWRASAELEWIEQSFNKKLNENKQETKQWSSLFENKVETLITDDIEKVQGSHKLKNRNEQLLKDVTKKIEKEILEKFRIGKKNWRFFKTMAIVDKIWKLRDKEHGSG